MSCGFTIERLLSLGNAFISSSTPVGLVVAKHFMATCNGFDSQKVVSNHITKMVIKGTFIFCCEAAAQQGLSCWGAFLYICFVPWTGILAMCFETTLWLATLVAMRYL